MKPEDYKPKKGKPRRKGKINKFKNRTFAAEQELKPITSQQLREAYNTRIEWASKLIPKLQKETEPAAEKEEPR
jgi:hypothetical protein